MIKNAKFTKKMAILLFIIAGIVGLIAIILISINATTFMTAVKEAVQNGQGTSKDLYEKYFVSQVLVYAFNILSVQGALAAFSLIGGLLLLKSTKANEEIVEESLEAEEIDQSTETEESAEESESN